VTKKQRARSRKLNARFVKTGKITADKNEQIKIKVEQVKSKVQEEVGKLKEKQKNKN
jgi:uncharacterized protein YjbJ (UPF0337 family)